MMARQPETMMRKFLVVLDDSRECLNAIRFAALRAAHTGGGVTILSIIPPEEFQHWMGVADLMREEARERIEAHFEVFAKWMRDKHGIQPELVIREGQPVDEILAQITDDPGIAILVLGAGDGPVRARPAGDAIVAQRGYAAGADHHRSGDVVQGTDGDDRLGAPAFQAAARHRVPGPKPAASVRAVAGSSSASRPVSPFRCRSRNAAAKCCASAFMRTESQTASA